MSSQQSATSGKSSLRLSAFKQNWPPEGSGRMIRSILLNKDARQIQSSSVVRSEQQIHTSNPGKDKRPPRPQNVQLLKDENGALGAKVTGNDCMGFPTRSKRNVQETRIAFLSVDVTR